MKSPSLLSGSLIGMALATALQAQLPPGVPGKEYTSFLDSAGGVPAPGTILGWDGLGAAGPIAGVPGLPPFYDVDGQAFTSDFGTAGVIGNALPMVFSVVGDDPGTMARIWYETPAGGTGTWATAADVDIAYATPPTFAAGDLNSLELWGPALPTSDTTYVSITAKPLGVGPGLGDPGGFSIYTVGGVGVVSTVEIASAISPSLGGPVDPELIDLDALMLEDTNGSTVLDSGDRMIFSISAMGGIGPWDGGEIWTYTLGGGAGPAAFLFHGGHLWDTAFPVASTFGVASEDIDALEALQEVPEPGTVAAGVGLGALVLARWYRARRRA